MCASFHPRDDLIVSASLDKTIRVWVIGGHIISKEQVSSVDVKVKHVLIDTDAGVNWASFHPSLPLIVSGAVDGKVKLWHINETNALRTLRGHMKNVSSVMFCAKRKIIVSTSMDKSIRVWDHGGNELQIFPREHDRFWMLAVHPVKNILAAAHDSGMTVFKVERERPAFALSGDSMIYTMNDTLRRYEFLTRTSSELGILSHPKLIFPYNA